MDRLVPHEITNPFDATLMWVDYKSTSPPEETRDAYGSPFPRPAFYGDKLFTFRHKDNPLGRPIAWARLTPEPEEMAVWSGMGVWPEFRGQGFSTEIRDFAVAYAFYTYEFFKVSQVRVGVRKTNLDHLEKWLERTGGRSVGTDSPWVYSGEVWYPLPGYKIFSLTREAYDAARKVR